MQYDKPFHENVVQYEPFDPEAKDNLNAWLIPSGDRVAYLCSEFLVQGNL